MAALAWTPAKIQENQKSENERSIWETAPKESVQDEAPLRDAAANSAAARGEGAVHAAIFLKTCATTSFLESPTLGSAYHETLADNVCRTKTCWVGTETQRTRTGHSPRNRRGSAASMAA